MLKTEKTIYNVAVIGGGPAGMMAAGRAAELGAKVALLEKNETLGKKLLLTGKGRCNLAHAEFNPKSLVKEFGREGDFLLSPLFVFGVEKTIEFFEKRGLKTKIERGKRVFPESDNAEDVLNVLIKFLKEGKVEIITAVKVKELKKDGNKITKAILDDKTEILAKNYIICTGGKSYPVTGSSGDGFLWLKNLGHEIVELRPVLVPLKIKENWPKKAQGLTLKNAKLTIFCNNQRKDSRFGELLFTHFGISGPIVLDVSKKVGELLKKGAVKLLIDLKPALDFGTLNKRVQNDFIKYQKKVFKNSLDDLLPQKLIPVIIELSGISPEKKVCEITKKEREILIKLLKGLEMTVEGLLGFNEAIVTSGGVSLKEIDAKTMRSKIIENLYFAGEIINLDGPSGGYNLQVCWSTGYVAGQSSIQI